jgi:hypothetical protein
MTIRTVAVAALLAGLTACSGTLTVPQLTGCIADADAQKLLTRTEAKLDRVVCAGSDWAVASYTYTAGTGKKNEPAEAILAKYDGQWRALVQGVSVQELCTPAVKEQVAKAPSPIKELTGKC